MNCIYCGSKVFYDEKCCSQCGAPIAQGVEKKQLKHRELKNIAVVPSVIHFNKNESCEDSFCVLGITDDELPNPIITQYCDYKILGKDYGIIIKNNIIYKPTDATINSCSIVILVSYKYNNTLNDYIVVDID